MIRRSGLNKRHRKFFMYGDRELLSSDSEDEDFVLSPAQVKKPSRPIRKKAKLSKGHPDCPQSESSILTDYYDDPWSNRIPVEILFNIFKYVLASEDWNVSSLKSISKVCVSWYEVSIIPSLWDKADLSVLPKKNSKFFEKFFLHDMPQLTSVNLSGWDSVKSENLWELMIDSCPNLTSIDLTGTKITGPTLLMMAIKCGSLNSITLSKIETNAVNPTFLSQLFEVMNVRLKSFCLSYCQINGFARPFGVLLAKCPNLETFELSGIRSMSTITVKVGDLQRAWKNLRVLRLANEIVSCMDEPCPSGFPELRELSLCNLKNSLMRMNDFTSNLVRTSDKLVLLDIRMISFLSPPLTSSLVTKDLSHLYLAKIQGFHVQIAQMLKKWNHSLEVLDLSEIGYPGCNFVIEVMMTIDSFLSLKVLSIKGLPVAPCHVLHLLAACPNLTELDLVQCRELPRGTRTTHHQHNFKKLIALLKSNDK